MLVSVLLPYRDAAATIVEAAASVLAERDVPLELVAIDDGSADDGPARLAALDDARVVHVRTGGVGIARALNRGLEVSRGDFVARMDGDDVSLPGRFAAQLELLARAPNVAAVGTLVEAFPDVGRGLADYVAWQNALVTPEDHARDLFVESPLCHPSVMLRRAPLEAAGGWRDHAWPEDYDLWLRLDAAGHALAKVPRVLFRWRHRGDRMTFTDPRFLPARFFELKARFLPAKLEAMQRALVVWGAGKTGKRTARALEAHGVRPARFVDIDPLKIGSVARSAPIVSPAEIDPARDAVLVAVGARGAREIVRGRLVGRGFVEGRDFICAA